MQINYVKVLLHGYLASLDSIMYIYKFVFYYNISYICILINIIMAINIPETVDIDKHLSIVKFCNKYFISKYTINPDGSIDILQDTYINMTFLYEIPIKINKVMGDLNISMNIHLTTLHNFPNYIDGDIRIISNKRLPDAVKAYLHKYEDDDSKIKILLKYQDYYNVWTSPSGFDQDAFNDLTMDIEDGLL